MCFGRRGRQGRGPHREKEKVGVGVVEEVVRGTEIKRR